MSQVGSQNGTGKDQPLLGAQRCHCHGLLCVSREEFRAAIVELLPYKTTKKPHQNSPKDKVVVVRMGGTESVLGQATPVPLPSPVHCTPCSSSLSSR